jgi:hypothetical protein
VKIFTAPHIVYNYRPIGGIYTDIQNEILSGKLQRDTKDEWGDKVIDCKTTFETLK